MESAGNNKLSPRGVDSGSLSRGSGRSTREGSGSQENSTHSSRVSYSSTFNSSGNSVGGIIVASSRAGRVIPAPRSSGEWEMFQFGKYPMDILEVLSGHQTHQFKGLGLERQLQHQQQVQLHQHQQQLQQQHGEPSGTLLSGIGLGSLQGSRSNVFTESSSIFAKMSAPPSSLQQAQPASSQSSQKTSKASVNAGSGSGGAVAYPQFLRTFHPSEAALAQEQLHPGISRFEHFGGGTVGGGASMIGGVVAPGPPPLPPPLHPGLSVPQASPGPSSSPPPSNSTSAANNPTSNSAVVSLGQQLVGGQSDARSLHQQFSCMLAANQYFLSGVPPNTSLEQFLVQQGTHNHLGLGLGQGSADSNSSLAPPPALHPSHAHSNPTSQQQQQIPPHALSHPHSHPHSHHPLHPAPQPSTLGGFDFQGIPVLSSNQLASIMQQETGLPIHLPLHLSLAKDEGKDNVAVTGGNGGGGRRKKAMAGYLPQRKSESNNNSSSNCNSNGDSNTSNNSRGNSHNVASGLRGGGGVEMSSLGEDHSSLLRSTSSSTSAVVSSSSSSAPLSTSSSVPIINGSQISKPDTLNSVATAVNQPEPEPLYHCGECGKTFTHLSSLRRHLRSHGLGSAGTVTSNSVQNSVTNHNQHHPSNSNLPHSTQDATSQSVSHHQQQQQGVITLQQQSNSAPISSSSCPSPEKTHCCPECGKRFKKRGHLLQHGVIHSGARPFSCTVCQRSFNRRESLTRHEKIHEDKPFRCPACGRCFRESTSLLNHAASATCGKPGKGLRARRTNDSSDTSLDVGGNESFGLKSSKAGMIAIGDEREDFQGGQLSSEGLVYGKTEEEEERGAVDCIIGIDEEDGEKAELSCGNLFQPRRHRDVNRNKTEGKHGSEFSRNRYVSYRNDDYHADYKHRSQGNPTCYSGGSCGNRTVGLALKKAPLAPTLHPHPQTQTQHHHQQQAHLQLSSLLDDSEDDVTSSVNSAMSAVSASATSCTPGEHSVGGLGERRDIIGGLLGGLGFGSLGVSPNGPSTSSVMEKVFRGSANEDCMGSTMMSLTEQSQEPQQFINVKPKKPRKPRPKKEPRPASGMGGEGNKRKRQSGGGIREDGRERPYLCSVCGRGFSRRETLRRHDRIHTGEKPHHCSVCGKNFREAFHLSKHHTVHSGEKNYKCTLCGKDFGYAQSLKRHGKLHQKGDFGDKATAAIANACNSNNSCTPTPEGSISQATDQENSCYYSQDKPQGSNTQPPPRLYTCVVCWKSFHHHFQLTAHHQAAHGNGEKHFSCEVCGKAFAYANSLTRHRLSQHGLTRTGQANPPGVGNGTAERESSGVSESEVAANSLLHLVPPTGTQGGYQTHASFCHTQHPAPQQSSPGLSPFFYLPESGASSAHISSVSHASQNHSITNHQQPTTVKGEPIYQANSASLLSPSLFLPDSQHQSQHIVGIKTCNVDQKDYESQEFVRKHKGKKLKDSNLARETMDESDNGRFSFSQRKLYNNRAKLQKRKTIHQQHLKKKLAEFLHIRNGRRAWHTVSCGFKYLLSLKAPQKRFPCPYCPCITFPRQAGLLVHCAVRHSPRISSQHLRLECLVCGKRSRKLLAALNHRGFHLAQGSFTCPHCPSRFWNGALLRRHKFACRGLGKGSRFCSLKQLNIQGNRK